MDGFLLLYLRLILQDGVAVYYLGSVPAEAVCRHFLLVDVVIAVRIVVYLAVVNEDVTLVVAAQLCPAHMLLNTLKDLRLNNIGDDPLEFDDLPIVHDLVDPVMLDGHLIIDQGQVLVLLGHLPAASVRVASVDWLLLLRALFLLEVGDRVVRLMEASVVVLG